MLPLRLPWLVVPSKGLAEPARVSDISKALRISRRQPAKDLGACFVPVSEEEYRGALTPTTNHYLYGSRTLDTNSTRQ